jgi:hypothetical protein
MAVTALADLAGLVKTLYPADKLEAMVLQNFPLLGALPKDKGFRGENLKVPVITSNGLGRNATFATAQTTATAPGNSAFFLTRAMDYAVYQISGDVIDSVVGGDSSFIPDVKLEIDAKMRALTQSVAHKLFRDGTGSLGVVVNAAPGPANTFSVNIEDGIFFDVGMTLIATTGANSAAAARGGGATMIVTGIADGAAGEVNITCGAGLIGGLAAGDHVILSGDRIAGPVTLHTQKTCLQGLEGWLNPTAGGLANTVPFFTVNRSTSQKLGGVIDPTAYATVEEALINLAASVYARGGRPDTAVINWTSFRQLQKEVEGKTQYNKVAAKSYSGGDVAGLFYKAIQLDGPVGPINVISDVGCQRRTGYMLTLNTWKLRSNGDFVKSVYADGPTGAQLHNWLPTADGYEGRLVFRGNLSCNAPHFNGIATALPVPV